MRASTHQLPREPGEAHEQRSTRLDFLPRCFRSRGDKTAIELFLGGAGKRVFGDRWTIVNRFRDDGYPAR